MCIFFIGNLCCVIFMRKIIVLRCKNHISLRFYHMISWISKTIQQWISITNRHFDRWWLAIAMHDCNIQMFQKQTWFRRAFSYFWMCANFSVRNTFTHREFKGIWHLILKQVNSHILHYDWIKCNFGQSNFNNSNRWFNNKAVNHI